MANIFFNSTVETEQTNMFVPIYADKLRHGELAYDEPQSENTENHSSYCSQCGLNLGISRTNPQGNTILLDNSFHRVCDLCIGFTRLSRTNENDRLIILPNIKVSQQALTNYYLAAIEASAKSEKKSEKAINEIEYAISKTRDLIGTDDPKVFLTWLKQNKYYKSLQQYNKLFLVELENCDAVSDHLVVDPILGEIDKSHEVSFFLFEKSLTKDKRYYSFEELKALYRNKNKHYKSIMLSDRVFVKRNLFIDLCEKNKNELHSLSNRVDNDNYIFSTLFKLAVDKTNDRDDFSYFYRSEVEKEVDALINQVESLNSNLKNSFNEYINVSYLAKEYMNDVENYHKELIIYRQQISDLSSRLSSLKRDNLDDETAILALNNINESVNNAIKNYTSISSSLQKILSTKEKKSDIVNHYVKQIHELQNSIHKFKENEQKYSEIFETISIITAYLNQLYFSQNNFYDKNAYSFLLSDVLSDSLTTDEKVLAANLSNLFKKMIEMNYLEADVDSLIDTLINSNKSRELLSSHKLKSFLSTLSGEYLTILRLRKIKSFKKKAKTTLLILNALNLRVIKYKPIKQFVEIIKSILKQAVDMEYIDEYKWWHQSHFNSYLYKKKMQIYAILFVNEELAKFSNLRLILDSNSPIFEDVITCFF